MNTENLSFKYELEKKNRVPTTVEQQEVLLLKIFQLLSVLPEFL